MKRLDEYWESRNPLSLLLLPLSSLFELLAWSRRRAYRLGLKAVYRAPVPVIVVGNITVGGTGKTPLVIWLVEYLKERGFRPGIVSRGYGGKVGAEPRRVQVDSDPVEVGDEPLLLVQRTGCPMYVASDRPAAARALLEHSDCNIIVSDDGLQHYALGRDIEIVVVDGRRRFGNGFCLPAGPLRERVSRLQSVDLVVANGRATEAEYLMSIQPGKVVNLSDPKQTCVLDELGGRPLHAIAGIGNPARFFDMLRRRGLQIIELAFPDHHAYISEDISPPDGRLVLMTEKDAVKCRAFAQPRHWYVRIDAKLDENFAQRLGELLDMRCK